MSIVSNGEIVTALGGSVSADDQNLITLIHTWTERLLKDYVGYHIEQATYTHILPLATQSEVYEELITGYEGSSDGRAIAYGPRVGSNRVLQLWELPVRSITSVNEDLAEPPTFSSGTLLTSGSDYRLDEEQTGLSWTGFLYRVSSSWSRIPRTIKVIYVAGLTAAELQNDYPEFKMAALISIIKAFNELKMQQGPASGGSGGVGPVTAETLADWSISYASGNNSSNDKNFGLLNRLPIEAMRILEGKVRMSKFRQ